MKETEEKSLDSQLWHACAGGMVQMPPINSVVFYFPQGHAEHTLHADLDFGRVPPFVLCRVAHVKFMADPETDEVYARLRLVPVGNHGLAFEDDGVSLNMRGSEAITEKPASFAKTLTQSDANNGGGFSVPRYCAETIFPRLDYTVDPPVQTVIAKDIHGEIWKFRHIYRGTPRRHLLTTGWSAFVNQKKLVAGDSVVFLRAENGDLCIGIRRAKRGIGIEFEYPSGWNSGSGNCVSAFRGFSALLREHDDKLMRGNSNSGGRVRGRERARPESVVEAAALAASGQTFEVVYYPRASTPEFCVKASSVRAAMRTCWCSGMRFKMPFETEDSSRISWFMGTISSVQAADPIRWPNSPWRLLQVTWDEPDLLQNVKCVNPWLVEVVSNVPIVHLSPFSPPKKKLRLPQRPDFVLDGQYSIPSFSGNPLRPSSPLCCVSDNTPAGIQGARHAQLGIPFTDLHLYDKLQLGLFPSCFQQFDQNSAISSGILAGHTNSNENVSCLLAMGNPSPKLEKSNNLQKPHFLLFGQPILTAQQISCNYESAVVPEVLFGKSLSNETLEQTNNLSDGLGSTLVQCSPLKNSSSPKNYDFGTTELGLDTGHCKVFMESEDVGQTLDLSVLVSYEELYGRLSNMVGIERSEMLSNVLYQDATGCVKHTGDEPFSDFMRAAKRLTILMDSGCSNIGKTWITGPGNAENGLGSSK